MRSVLVCRRAVCNAAVLRCPAAAVVPSPWLGTRSMGTHVPGIVKDVELPFAAAAAPAEVAAVAKAAGVGDASGLRVALTAAIKDGHEDAVAAAAAAAIANGHAEVLRMVLDMQPGGLFKETDTPSPAMSEAISTAVSEGHRGVVEVLAESPGKLYLARACHSQPTEDRYNSITIARLAAKSKAPAAMLRFVHQHMGGSAALKVKFEAGETVAHDCAGNLHGADGAAALKALVELVGVEFVKPEGPDADRKPTIALMATMHGNFDAVRYAAETLKLPLFQPDGVPSVLSCAAALGHDDIVRYVIAQDGATEAYISENCDHGGETVAVMAAAHDQVEVLTILRDELPYGAKMLRASKDSQGLPLAFAAARQGALGAVDFVHQLCGREAFMESGLEGQPFTAAHLAIEFKQTPVLRYMKTHGLIDYDAKDFAGVSVRTMLEKRNLKELLD